MAFTEVQDLSCDVTISLGGVNKKTGKGNPKQIQGYFLGARKVEDRKKKSGFSFIYAFQTPQGNVGVWGKTDMDRKMAGVTPGVMVRVTHSGMRGTPNGEMYVYKVEVDKSNSIEVQSSFEPQAETSEFSASSSEDLVEETSIEDEVSYVDEAPPARPSAPARAAVAPDLARQQKVKELLARAKSSQ